MKTTGLRRVAIAFGALICASLPAFGSTILFACNGNVDTAHGGTCATLNTTIAGLYSTTFTNANASIYLQMGNTGLGSSLQYYDTQTYANYYAALAAHESGINDATAVGSLGGGVTNPVNAGDGVALPSALAAALGLPGGTGIDLANNPCVLGTGGCYNGIITISDTAPLNYRDSSLLANQYDFYAVVEHEVNEILGTSSCIATVSSAPGLSANCGNGGNGVAAADLFRYSAPGVRSYISQGNGTSAYFSINGGVTNIAGYNNTPNGADYGDWDSASLRIQNAFGDPGVSAGDITTDGRSEIMVLDAVGYNLEAVPEPGTVALFSSGLVLLAFASRRRARQA